MVQLSRGVKISLIVGSVILVVVGAIVISIVVFVIPLFGLINMDSISAKMTPSVGGEVRVVFKLKNKSATPADATFSTELSYGSETVSHLPPTSVSLPGKDKGELPFTAIMPVNGAVASSIAKRCKGGGDAKVPLRLASELKIGNFTANKSSIVQLPCSKVTIMEASK